MQETGKIVPIEPRTFRFKNPAVEFFCPLCRTARAITTHYKLTAFHYLQIIVICSTLAVFLWPWVGFKSLFSFFLVWMAFEGVLRRLWRKEVPCPHCGFDASWYKTNVKVARRKVQEFWDSQNQGEEEPQAQATEESQAPETPRD